MGGLYGGVFEQLNTISHVLLLSAAMIHALRLDRSILYLISAGASMAIPALVVLSLGVESGGWMTIMVVIVGMTATDRGLSREMIEQSSWFVIFGILLLQIVASIDQANFVLGSFSITEQPFGLSFWLWAALLVGWFAPTTMQRTPAMPIGLALALSLLEAEAVSIAWVVGSVHSFISKLAIMRGTGLFDRHIGRWSLHGSSLQRLRAAREGYSWTSEASRLVMPTRLGWDYFRFDRPRHME